LWERVRVRGASSRVRRGEALLDESFPLWGEGRLTSPLPWGRG